MNSQSLITYKLKYNASDEANAFILKCMKQYSSLLHYGYNRVVDGWSAKHIKDAMKTQLNNVELMDSHIVSCAQQQATGINEQKTKANPGYKIIFGGKKNYIRRCKGLISKEEYQYNQVTEEIRQPEYNNISHEEYSKEYEPNVNV